MVQSKRQRQLALLVVLAAAFAVILWMRSGADPAVPAGTPQGSSNPAAGTGRQQAQPQAPVADVKLELLQAQRDAARESERNPFRFRTRTPPPAPERPQPTTERALPQEPPVPQGPPPPPPIPLKFIGLLSAPTQAGRVAVLADGRGNTFQAREGDIIEGRYRLLRIGADSAELAYTDGRGRQVIRLSGQ